MKYYQHLEIFRERKIAEKYPLYNIKDGWLSHYKQKQAEQLSTPEN